MLTLNRNFRHRHGVLLSTGPERFEARYHRCVYRRDSRTGSGNRLRGFDQWRSRTVDEEEDRCRICGTSTTEGCSPCRTTRSKGRLRKVERYRGRPGQDGGQEGAVDCLLALGGSFRRKLSLSNFGEHLSRYTVLVSIISFVVYTFASRHLLGTHHAHSFYMVRQPPTTILIVLHKIQLYFTRPRAPAYRKNERRTQGAGRRLCHDRKRDTRRRRIVIIRSVTPDERHHCHVYSVFTKRRSF